ncbi:MAG: OmpA family protein [Myxococcales bacterium]|nr:OmpA family protein [Myxococcales bacterium]
MNQPEDRDNFQDEDGCPDGDNDGDGILDIEDDCPNDATNACGVKFNPCEIVITQAVYFQYDKDIIKEESYAILDAVAAVLLSRTQIELVQVEGHTDSDGPDDYNLDLSQRRAEAVVRYLTEKGVDAARMTPKGYGETRPIASNKAPSGRAKNRRVQFIILKPSQETCVQAPAK